MAGDPYPGDDDAGDVGMWAKRFDGPGIAVRPMPTAQIPSLIAMCHWSTR
ncbi:hypothetical protein [Nonomuraea sp. NPDC002799]